MKGCDVRHDLHVPNSVTRAYGVDRTGTISYAFNSLGYRGEEYDPAAKFRICVIGESCAFGVGINLEDTFGHKLKLHIAAALGLEPGEVNLINFSFGGASADYCVRTLYRQLPECTLDLLIWQLPPPNRTEYFDGKIFHSYSANAVTPQNRESAPIPLVAFCDYYNEQVGGIGLVKNVLLMQALLKERKIDYVLATEDKLFAMTEAGYLKDFADDLDPRPILLHRYLASRVDLAADGVNAGLRCHAAFAVALMAYYGQLLLERGSRQIGGRIADYASRFMDTDQNWIYCEEAIGREFVARISHEGGLGVEPQSSVATELAMTT